MESIYEMFKRPVFGLVYRYAQNQAAAEDLLQDVFLKVFGNMRNVRDAATFPGWVFRIAVNTAYSYLRQKRTQADRLVPLDDLDGKIEDRTSAPVEKDIRGPLEAGHPVPGAAPAERLPAPRRPGLQARGDRPDARLRRRDVEIAALQGPDQGPRVPEGQRGRLRENDDEMP